MNLLNDVFNTDKIELNNVNKKYFKIFVAIILLLTLMLFGKKNYYYENNLIIDSNSIVLLVDTWVINQVKNKQKILVNEIESEYSIDKIISQGNMCYVGIKLDTDIKNISDTKYKILLGKETILEYIIRVIRKVS